MRVGPTSLRWAALWIDARIEILMTFYRLSREWPTYSASRALDSFVLLYNSGKVQLSAETRRRYPRCSRGTLYRWDRCFQAGGTRALVPQYGNRLGQGRIDQNPILRAAIRAELRINRPAPTAMLRALKVGLPGHKLPSVSTLGAFMQRSRSASVK